MAKELKGYGLKKRLGLVPHHYGDIKNLRGVSYRQQDLVTSQEIFQLRTRDTRYHRFTEQTDRSWMQDDQGFHWLQSLGVRRG